jgi:hypothetical protein
MAGKGGDVLFSRWWWGREASRSFERQGKGKEILRIKANQLNPGNYRFDVARRGLDMLNK